MEDKKRLREQMKETLKSMGPQSRVEGAKRIHEQLFQLKAWENAHTVAVTVSMGTEIDTRGIIKKGWTQNKTVAVPKCLPKEKHLDFRVITRFQDLESVFYGLLEPKPDTTKSIDKDNIDLIVVPGLIFDEKGYRVGFGGGYYDRFLTNANAIKVALAFDEQIMDQVPREAHDIPVDIILTPTRVIQVGALQ